MLIIGRLFIIIYIIVIIYRYYYYYDYYYRGDNCILPIYIYRWIM